MTYALDTNTIVHYLRKEPNVLKNFDNAAIQGDTFFIPKLVDYEIRRGFSIVSAPRKEDTYNVLTEQCVIAPISDMVWEYAIQIYSSLYKKGFSVGELDILIAAVSITNDCTLVTSNTKDFVNMDGLALVDWKIAVK